MLRQLIISLFLLASGLSLQASHILGGRIQLRLISGLTYEVSVIGYRDTESGIRFGTGTLDFGDGSSISSMEFVEEPFSSFVLSTAKVIHTFSAAGSYLVSYSEFARTSGVMNITSSDNTDFYIESEILIDPFIPNTPVELEDFDNFSFLQMGCLYQSVLGVNDREGDLVEFSLITPKSGRSAVVEGYVRPDNLMFYEGDTGFLDLNGNNGSLQWLTPDVEGDYIMSFKVVEKRIINGELIKLGSQTVELTFDVSREKTEPVPVVKLPSSECDLNFEVTVEADQVFNLGINRTDDIASINGITPEEVLNTTFDTTQIFEIELKPNLSKFYEVLTFEASGLNGNKAAASVGIAQNCDLLDLLDSLNALSVEVDTDLPSKNSVVKISPNPAKDQFQIFDLPDAHQVVIYDMGGNQIEKIILNSSKSTVQLADVDEGIYLVTVLDDEGVLIGQSKLSIIQ